MEDDFVDILKSAQNEIDASSCVKTTSGKVKSSKEKTAIGEEIDTSQFQVGFSFQWGSKIHSFLKPEIFKNLHFAVFFPMVAKQDGVQMV